MERKQQVLQHMVPIMKIIVTKNIILRTPTLIFEEFWAGIVFNVSLGENLIDFIL